MSFQRSATVLLWIARAAWVGALALGPNAIGAATIGGAAGDRSTTLPIAAAVIVWLLGVACLSLPSTVTLALGRVLIPFAVAFGALVARAANWSPDSIGALICVSVAAAAIWSGDVGEGFVQASAYGDEERFVLRAPRVYLLLGMANWAIATVCLLAGGARITDGRSIGGTALIGLGIVASAFGWPRWYRTARRWLVLVPAGLVIHDHVLLAETTMWRRDLIRSVTLASSESGSFDLTGSALGQSVQIEMKATETVVLAARPSHPTGTVIHLTSVRVTPTRPGRFIRSATDRRFATATRPAGTTPS